MNNDLIIQLLESLKADLVNTMQASGKNTTGQTAKQIAVTRDGNTIKLQIPGYMLLLETGRGPTGPDAVAGEVPMITRIQEWCRAKGIPDKAAWAIKKSIDKKGFKGVPGLLSEPLGNDNIELRLKPVLEAIASGLTAQLTSSLDELSFK